MFSYIGEDNIPNGHIYLTHNMTHYNIRGFNNIMSIILIFIMYKRRFFLK